MIALTRGIGDSLLSLTVKVGEDTPSPAFEPETLAFESRVLIDGGKILDIGKLDRFIKANKSLGLYANPQFAVSKQFGYKLDGSGNIIKIYDASKNGNDLDVSRGTVEEDIEHDMFFLDNTFFKDESVTSDVVGNEFTVMTDIIHPNPGINTVNYFLGFGDVSFYAGGTYLDGTLGIRSSNYVFRTLRETFTDTEDANVFRKLDYRYTNGGAKIVRKDGDNMGSQASFIDESYGAPAKIVYGGRVDETSSLDADSYLNNTFFYNKYLTDQELEDINDTL